MEDLLALYQLPHDPARPLVCLDETRKELHGHRRDPLPMQPGQPLREDDEYDRNGAAHLFMVFAPLEGWREVTVKEQHTRREFAHVVRHLLEHRFPEAKVVRLVMDNLNTHTLGALYETFPPAEARALAERLEFHYTPVHGSWLNMAEIELAVVSRQCLDRRLATLAEVQQEVTAWGTPRNERAAQMEWRFTTDDARIKLKRLYPSLPD
jgi:hypothetical protein